MSLQASGAFGSDSFFCSYFCASLFFYVGFALSGVCFLSVSADVVVDHDGANHLV